MKKKIIGIACIDSQRGIGYKNNLLFQIKEDLQFFQEKTLLSGSKDKKNAIIMGRHTFHSIGKSLPNRVNCIITSKTNSFCSLSDCFFNNISDCLEELESNTLIEKIFVIGGGQIYQYFMDRLLFDEIYITHVETEKKADCFFPLIPFSIYSKIEKIKGLEFPDKYNIGFYHLKKSEYSNTIPCLHDKFISCMTKHSTNEFQYLKLLRKVLHDGNERKTRNGNTFSLFGEKMEFDIQSCFPLLTTKKMYFKGIFKELLWFLNGQTDSKLLEKDGVNIWKGNSAKETLQKIGLSQYKEGDCGPVYGFQWRHFNEPYKNCEEPYNGGIDQLQNIINEIKSNPSSRRLFMSAWNPCQLDKMVLPPCHVSYQFYVRDCRYLDCSMYQRSGDLFLGVPFNIASTSLLVYILSNICNLQPGKVILTIGDAHIYENHVDAVKEQLKRFPSTPPTLYIKEPIDKLENIPYENFEVINYNPASSIRAEMAV